MPGSIDLHPVHSVVAPCPSTSNRYPDQGPTVAREQSAHRSEEGTRVRDMLKRMVQHDRIEATVELLVRPFNQGHATQNLLALVKKGIDTNKIFISEPVKGAQGITLTTADIKDSVDGSNTRVIRSVDPGANSSPNVEFCPQATHQSRGWKTKRPALGV